MVGEERRRKGGKKREEGKERKGGQEEGNKWNGVIGEPEEEIPSKLAAWREGGMAVEFEEE